MSLQKVTKNSFAAFDEKNIWIIWKAFLGNDFSTAKWLEKWKTNSKKLELLKKW